MSPGAWIRVADDNQLRAVEIGGQSVKVFSSGGALWTRCPKLEPGKYSLVVDGSKQRTITVR